MKILYVITKSNWGGAQRNVFDLATGMKAAGHEVKVALGGAGVLKDRLEAAGIYTYPIASMKRDISIGGDAGSLRELFSVIRTQKPDVLHLHSPKAAGLGAFCGRILRVPHIVMTVHGWTWNESRPVHEKAAIVFFSWLTGILCHKIVTISRHDYEQALHFPGFKKRLELVPLGIKPAALMSVDGAKQFLAKAVGLDLAEFSKRVVIGTIAELHPNKGLPSLIRAIADVVATYPTTLCVIMGEGEERGKIETAVRERRLERNVFLLGYVEDAAQYLKAYTMFVLSSVKEGLPYVLLEAGAASLPVVSTMVGGIPDIIQDMYSGILVQPRKSRDLAHALQFVIEHPKERREYGAKLREKVATTFSLDRMIEHTQKIYLP